MNRGPRRRSITKPTSCRGAGFVPRHKNKQGRRRLAYGPEVSLYIDNPPKSKAQIRNEQTYADRLLADLEKAGRIVIERGAVDVRTGVRGWRILEVRAGQ